MDLYQVDAFTDRAFSGNPAAVCILQEKAEDGWMQAVAGEMNLPETAFLWGEDEGYRLRWFTPCREEELCGHATLASAFVLWETERAGLDEEITFYTRSGVMTAGRRGEWIELDFPAEPEEAVEGADALVRALGVNPVYIGRNRLDYLVEVASEAEVRGCGADFSGMGEVDFRGVIVTSRSDSPDFDFVSRFLDPEEGMAEDPVTGSAHCCLAPFWQKRLGKKAFTAYQASERGGVVRARLENGRVVLGGKAVMVFRGWWSGG